MHELEQQQLRKKGKMNRENGGYREIKRERINRKRIRERKDM